MKKENEYMCLVALGCYFISAFLSYDKCVQNSEVLGSLYPITDSQSTGLKNLLYNKNAQMKYLSYFFLRWRHVRSTVKNWYEIMET